MRKLVLSLATLGATLALNPAAAGTMGPVEETISWAGFYLGANAGYGWNHRSSHIHVPHDFGSRALYLPAIRAGAQAKTIGYTQEGAIGGGQIGYSYQLNRFVVGLEADFDGTDIHDTSKIRRVNLGTGFAPWFGLAGAKLDWLGTVRGRLGMTPIPKALVYLTGGYAYGKVEHQYQDIFRLTNDIFTSNRSKNKSGWIVGFGGEWAFSDHFSFKTEYLYYNLGRTNDTTVAGGRDLLLVATGAISPLTVSFPNSGNIVRAGINYRFA